MASYPPNALSSSSQLLLYCYQLYLKDIKKYPFERRMAVILYKYQSRVQMEMSSAKIVCFHIILESAKKTLSDYLVMVLLKCLYTLTDIFPPQEE